MSRLSNLGRLVRDREMWGPYLRWFGARLLARNPQICPANNVAIGHWISFSEYFSYRNGVTAGEMQFLSRITKEEVDGDCLALDVGANVGMFTCAMAGVGFTRVHSFEPIPDTFVRLKQNVAHNGTSDRCVLNCMGVGAGRGMVEFATSARAPGVNRMASAATPFAHQIQQVPVISIDEYCANYKLPIVHLAKIDVEGMEELVLRGANAMLQRRAIKRILIEISPVNQPQVGLHIDGLLSTISEAGYEARRLREDGGIGELYERSYLQNCYQENAVLVPSR